MRAQRAIFVLATFVGSFVLFLIEPVVGKLLLPWFGGTSEVWNVCLLFFQFALLAGYWAADRTGRLKSPAKAGRVHLGFALIALAIAGVAFVPAAAWQPTGARSGVGTLILVLVTRVAAPFFAIAMGAPLLQKVFSQTNHPQAHDPYFLYSASNLGSFLALLSYPFFFEPRLTLTQQRAAILFGLALYAVLLALAYRRLNAHAAEEVSSTDEMETPSGQAEDKEPIGLWLALSAAPSLLLLASTADLTKNIAPIPLLWIAPLALYLLTFVIAFWAPKMSEVRFGRWIGSGLAAVGIGAFIGSKTSDGLMGPISMSLLSFFSLSFACHWALADRRPKASRLTTFYLSLSVGGALGGLFGALVAPLLFKRLEELPVGLAFALLVVGWERKDSPLVRKIGWLGTVLLAGFALAGFHSHWNWIGQPAPLTLLVLLIAVSLAARWGAALIMIATLWTFWSQATFFGEKLLLAERNYYGSFYVAYSTNPAGHYLYNGTILHGAELMSGPLAGQPLTYYTRTGPLGMAISAELARKGSLTIGVVGLGSGSTAAYASPTVAVDYYELNPAVAAMAVNPKYFTFVSGAKGPVKIILGDARLSMTDAPDGRYDLLVLDAFNSDSIPLHLLTEEAFQLYRSKMKPDGVILLHTSNRFLSLNPALAATGAKVGLQAAEAWDYAAETSYRHSNTSWVALSAEPSGLKSLEGQKFWTAYLPPVNAPVWTDDYSNVLGVFRR